MTLKERLCNLGLAGIAAVAMTGCYDSRYHFNGKINGEDVTFWEKKFGATHYLKVRRIDRTVVTYHDLDFIDGLDKILIKSSHCEEKRYNNRDDWTTPIFEEAKKQYDSYLAKILDAKTKEGLEALKTNSP